MLPHLWKKNRGPDLLPFSLLLSLISPSPSSERPWTTRRLFHWCEISITKVNEGSLNGLSPISSDIYNPIMIVQHSGVSAVWDYHFISHLKEIRRKLLEWKKNKFFNSNHPLGSFLITCLIRSDYKWPRPRLSACHLVLSAPFVRREDTSGI